MRAPQKGFLGSRSDVANRYAATNSSTNKVAYKFVLGMELVLIGV